MKCSLFLVYNSFNETKIFLISSIYKTKKQYWNWSDRIINLFIKKLFIEKSVDSDISAAKKYYYHCLNDEERPNEHFILRRKIDQ